MSDAPAPDIIITPGRQGRDERSRAGGDCRDGAEGRIWRQFRTAPPATASEDFSEYADSGVPSMFFNIGVYEPERVAAARNGTAPPLPANHSPLFAPVPKPTIQTGVEAHDARRAQRLRSARTGN